MERNNGLPSMTWTVIQYLFLSYMNKGVKKANGKHQESWRLLHNPPDMLTLQVLTQSNTRLKISHMDAKKIEKKKTEMLWSVKHQQKCLFPLFIQRLIYVPKTTQLRYIVFFSYFN